MRRLPPALALAWTVCLLIGGPGLAEAVGPARPAMPVPRIRASPHPAPGELTASAAAPSGRVFRHPGLLNSDREMLHWAVLAEAGLPAQAEGLARVEGGRDDLGATFLEHQPQAEATWSAVPHWSQPGSARRLLDDARVAYACALLWRAGRGPEYARQAVRVLDAWSGTLVTIRNSAGQPSTPMDTRQDYMLYTSYSWPALIWAAEILRHTPGSGWSPAGVEAFDRLLREVVRPAAEHPANELGNNWRSWRICFTIACAIYLDEPEAFETALQQYRVHLVSYLKDDLSGEMGRDLWHSQMGLVPLVLAAEMALHQGVDLYSHRHRLLFRGLEYQIPFCLGDLTQWPSGLNYNPGTQWDGSRLWSMYEFSHHHYHHRLGQDAPRHAGLLTAPAVLVLPALPSPRLSAPNLPRPYRAEDFYRTGYGTLTHASDPLTYGILAGFDLQQNPTTDQGLTLEPAGGTLQTVTDPRPAHSANGVLLLAHPSGQPVRVSRQIPLAGWVEVSFDYRFAAAGEILLRVGGVTVAALAAPSDGPGRDDFAAFRARWLLAEVSLPDGSHPVELELRGSAATQAWVDNLLATTPRQAEGIPLQPYLAWMEQGALGGGPAQLPSADPDGDGLPNLLEYALGLDPAVPSADPLAGSRTVPVQDRWHRQLAFSCDAARTDLVYGIEASSHPAEGWVEIARSTGGGPTQNLGGSLLISDSGAGRRTVIVTDAVPLDQQSRFVRLRVRAR